MKNPLANWWRGLSQRDRKTVSVGALFVLVVGVYQWLWTPLSDGLTQTQQSLQQQGQLLSWLQQHQQVMQRFTQAGYTTPSNTTEPLLTSVTQVFTSNSLHRYVASKKALSATQVRFELNDAPFDMFIKSVTDLWRHDLVQVSRLNVLHTTVPGVVKITVYFKRDKR